MNECGLQARLNSMVANHALRGGQDLQTRNLDVIGLGDSAGGVVASGGRDPVYPADGLPQAEDPECRESI